MDYPQDKRYGYIKLAQPVYKKIIFCVAKNLDSKGILNERIPPYAPIPPYALFLTMLLK